MLPVQFLDDAGNWRMPEWEEGETNRAGESASPQPCPLHRLSRRKKSENLGGVGLTTSFGTERRRVGWKD